MRRDRIIGKRMLEVYPATEPYWLERLGRVAETRIPARFTNYSSALDKWYEMSAYSPRPGYVATTLVNVSDTIELDDNREKVYQLAYLDPVTYLPNKSQFYKIASAVLEKDRNREGLYALLLFNLDNFGDICASYGSDMGDRVLARVSKRIAKCACDSCTVYHLSGARFLLFINRRGCARAIDQSEEMIHAVIGDPLEIQGNYFRMEASCGISFYPQDGTDLDELIMKADLALHWAARSGNGAYAHYCNSMGQELQNRTKMRNYLPKALENREFSLKYQPQIRADTGEIAGFEALLRWDSPELGEVPPGSFIEIAEESRLISEIGDWVLDAACRAMREVNERQGSRLAVAVNISVAQLRSDDFVPRTLSVIARSGLSPALLELEVTESVFLNNDIQAIRRLNALHDSGIRIALDDFGTGYSSLSLLNELKLSTIKIDKSFIARTDTRALTDMIIKMGHLMGTEVVAEGVETEEQTRFLTEKGCDRLQGFLIGRPLSLSDAVRLIEERRTEAPDRGKKD